jgi:hypothetical protein
MSAISKIGHSGSLLVATIVPASLMPVRCWIALQLRRDDLAGLADLQFGRHIVGVDRGARGTARRAELEYITAYQRTKRYDVLQLPVMKTTSWPPSSKSPTCGCTSAATRPVSAIRWRPRWSASSTGSTRNRRSRRCCRYSTAATSPSSPARPFSRADYPQQLAERFASSRPVRGLVVIVGLPCTGRRRCGHPGLSNLLLSR